VTTLWWYAPASSAADIPAEVAVDFDPQCPLEQQPLLFDPGAT